MVHQMVTIEHRMDRADGREVRPGELLAQISRIFGAPQPGYSRFKRTIVASMGAVAPIAKGLQPAVFVAVEDLVAGLPGNPELGRTTAPSSRPPPIFHGLGTTPGM